MFENTVIDADDKFRWKSIVPTLPFFDYSL